MCSKKSKIHRLTRSSAPSKLGNRGEKNGAGSGMPTRLRVRASDVSPEQAARSRRQLIALSLHAPIRPTVGRSVPRPRHDTRRPRERDPGNGRRKHRLHRSSAQIPNTGLQPSSEICESRSFFQCRDEGGRYFWRNAGLSKFELLSDPRVRNDCHSRYQRGDGKEAEQEASQAAIGFFHFNPRNRAKSVSVECSTQLCSTASAARRASETRFAVALPTRSIF